MKNILLISLLSSILMAESGASIYKKCAKCHGKHGEKKAVGRSGIIAKRPPSLTIKQLKAYKSGTLDIYGMGAVMKKNVSKLTNSDIKVVANYISHL